MPSVQHLRRQTTTAPSAATCDSLYSSPAMEERCRGTISTQLPCGYFFGFKCLRLGHLRPDRWECLLSLQVQAFKLQYRGCGHQIQPPVLDLATIALVSNTIPQDGATTADSHCPPDSPKTAKSGSMGEGAGRCHAAAL